MLAAIHVLLLAHFVFCNAHLISNGGSEGDVGFIFTVPRSVRSGRRESACLSLHGSSPLSGQINVTVIVHTATPSRASTVTTKIFDSENVGCFELKIPDTTDQKAKLHLQIKFLNESNYTINNVDEVNVVQNKVITIIQTDKSTYKPGDRVKIRILIVTPDLTVPKNLVIPIVKIRNPIGIAIGQWEDVTTELGLVQLEHQLSQDTMMGTWNIELPENDFSVKAFHVKEYYPPRFKINIEHPDTVYSNSNTFNITVCAKYFYGSSVKGTAHMKMQLRMEELTVNQIKELKHGCHKFVFERSEIPIQRYTTSELELTVTVTEQGTGHLESSTSSFKVSNEKYAIQFNNPSLFQPGIPYKGQVKVMESFEDVTNKTVKICYNFAINESWNLTAETCGWFKMNANNSINFTIFPYEEDILKINMRAIIEEEDNTMREHVIYFSAMRWYSPSNSYIHIYHNGSKLPVRCKSWQQFVVLYTFNTTSYNESMNEPILFHYMIKSKGHILKFGKVVHTRGNLEKYREDDYENIIGNINMKPNIAVDKFLLTIKIHQKLYSEAQLIVYYVRKDGEIVAGNIKVDVEKCLLNKVESTWSEKQSYPGETLNIRLKAASGSLCSVSAVDEGTLGNPVSKKTFLDDLIKSLQIPFIVDFETSTKCKADIHINFDAADRIPFWDLRRKKRFFEYGSEFYDALQLFYENDVLVMTDLRLVTRPCLNSKYDPRMMTIYEPTSYQTQVTDRGAEKRFYFPETWLWELVSVGRSGEIQLKREIPHSITQWIGNTVCISPSAGIGVSKTNFLTTFKYFFVDVLTPISVKREEVSLIKVIAFNYLNHSLPIRLSLEDSPNIRIAGSPEERSLASCVGPNDSLITTFRIVALSLGKVNITVAAEVDSSYPGECGPDVLINRKDIVQKSVLVQLEGFPFEATKSTFVCVDESSNDTSQEVRWNMELPHDAVKNSSKIKLLLDTDLLELTIQNIGGLVDMPTGCGEQIMSTLAPNLYILNYLKSTGNLTPDMSNKIQNYIKIGYERILKYRHQDGSFSAFGERYGNGSMFLTAFVLKTLSHASEHIYVDDHVLKIAAYWIVEKQLENGCFPLLSHSFHPSISDSTEGNIALTAYVLTALLESSFPIPEKVRENAKFCLRAHNSLDKYAMAITTYALTLVNWTSEADRSLSRLIDVATRQNNLMWWDDPESVSASLEMTAYVIMSLIKTHVPEKIAIATGAIRWLLTQRNAHGGFISTQDTVVALDALTKYALVAKRDDTNLTILLSTNTKQYSYRTTSKTRLKAKQITLAKFSNFINFNIKGHGCILLQCILRYNMPQIISSEALKVAVAASPVSTTDRCSVAEIMSCVSYNTPEKQANMAVLDVTLPSGYKGDRTSLYQLTKNQNSRVKRFEEVDDKVILYLTELNNEKVCVSFLINEQIIIDNRMEAFVRLYDYYNPEISAYSSYEIPNCLHNDINSVPTNTSADEIEIHAMNVTKRSLVNVLHESEPDKKNAYENNLTSGGSKGNTGLNPDFVDVDFDLAFPDGIEGPQPTYVEAPTGMQRNNP